MRGILERFAAEEHGAVTVDWVVLTAAIVGLAIAVVGSIANGALDYSTGLGAFVDDQGISTY